MRNLLLVVLAAVAMAACNNRKSDEFIINGQVQGEQPGEVYLQKSKDGRFEILDTAKVENGRFTFRGTVSTPDIYYIALDENRYISFCCFKRFFVKPYVGYNFVHVSLLYRH